MNIAIAEILRKANEESILILKNSPEQSLKRRHQLENYPKTENKGLIARLITTIKTRLRL
jgi:hypothetical protein